MAAQRTKTRSNQRLRTRKDLLDAAARLIKQGKRPDMDQIAREALVSRATAYRYFPSAEALLLEAPLDGEMPDPARLFPSTDPATRSNPAVAADRVDLAEASLHDMVYRNEAQLRAMLAASITLANTNRKNASTAVPVRQNRRTALIEAALAPARPHLKKDAYHRLCAALALFFGPESMIVFSDVLGIDPKSARRIKSWAVRALVDAALRESAAAR